MEHTLVFFGSADALESPDLMCWTGAILPLEMEFARLMFIVLAAPPDTECDGRRWLAASVATMHKKVNGW